jgi:hypothetical protein
MEARTTLRGGRISSSAVVTFIVALLVAFLLGGAGGYVMRSVTIPAATTSSTPIPETMPQQTLLPNHSGAKTLPQQTILPNQT